MNLFIVCHENYLPLQVVANDQGKYYLGYICPDCGNIRESSNYDDYSTASKALQDEVLCDYENLRCSTELEEKCY